MPVITWRAMVVANLHDDKSIPFADQSPCVQRDSELSDKFVPTLYMRAYVDKQGNPPSQQDIELIIDHLSWCISGDPRSAQQNATIDSQTRGHTSAAEIKQGRHRYLGRQIRAERIETFCEAVDRNLLQHNPDRGSSKSVVNNPFKYFGVTSHPHRRMNQHASQKSTNRIMTLVTNVGKYLKSEGSMTRSYETKSYTICHMADETEYRLSEELFCQMGGGYYYTGRGFNIAKADSASSGDLGETTFCNGTEQWAALPNEKTATATTDMNREHDQVLRTVSDNGDRRLVYGSAYAAIGRTILDESEKIKRELDEEDEVLVEASVVV